MSLLNCTKCSSQYAEPDEEAHLCPPCLAEKKQLAAEIDAKRKLRPPRLVKGNLQIYDESEKVRGFMRVRL